ncbi:MAG: T9SS type A sorting domain-containing protein [Candidatus Marinimicrobia bacterium]|nr:T9SS type A sorting domain-containing protein [Candidatus Neomarinimicrobiota bacterium]MCF7904461.1 T9SS type A sorting domain-containing protein [Candidatus Neomarinimicrobiota bacterium]
MSQLKLINIITLTFIVLIGTPTASLAKAFRVGQLPNGSVNGCANCHVNPAGGGTRNAFGQLVENSYLNNGNVVWGPALASADADGDGFSNGHELEDPFGLWASGSAQPGTAGFVSLPGVSNSTPGGAAEMFSLHTSFTGMGSYTNGYFELKLIDADNGEMLHQETVNNISAADFDFIIMHVLTSEGNYDLDFWVDVNRNNTYDAPPTDHAWRVQLNGVINNVSSSFTSNSNYTDIGGTVSVDEAVEVPTITQLYPNYPNPFNPTTKIRFELAQQENISLDVFDVRGTLVANLFKGMQSAGYHEISWDSRSNSGESLPAGVYIYTLRYAGSMETGRMMLLK